MTDSTHTPTGLTEQQVRHVAGLARLSLTTEELHAVADDLRSIIGFVDRLAQVDVEGVEPMASPHGHSNRLHDDTPIDPLPQQTVLDAAPLREGDYIAVPKVLDQGGDA